MPGQAFDAFFERLTGNPQHIAGALRNAIEHAGSSLVPRLSNGHPGWFGHGWVVSIVAHKAHCNL